MAAKAGYKAKVNSILQVTSPPAKTVMVYDGDCRFCCFWIRCWRRITADRIDYVPFQDPQVALKLPEIPREQFASAIQLIQPDGRVYSAAEAVFRALASKPETRWLLRCYRHSPTFARLAEASYQFVADYRDSFSAPV